MRGASKILFSAAVLALVGLVGGYAGFALSLPKQVVRPSVETDAIVVWTGGSDRINTALKLLEDGLSERMFVSGVDQTVTLDDILAVSAPVADDLVPKISFGQSANNTAGNAAETAGWMKAEGVNSVRLVTSAYHMPRSLLVLRRAMPEAEVIPHPVFPASVPLNEWWRRPGTALLIAGEYLKFIATMAGQRFDDAFGRTTP